MSECRAESRPTRTLPISVMVIQVPVPYEWLEANPGDVRTAFTRYRVRAAASGQGSAYREQFHAALAIMERDEGQGVSAERVAALVESIWRERHRRPRYICGHASQTVAAPAKRLLPARLFERLIADHYAARASRRSLAGAS